MDVVKLVKNGKGKFKWSEVVSEHDGYKLYIKVFRDAMKFDNIPAMTWDMKKIPNIKTKYNGVRLPASAHQLQRIADLTHCMLMTPKVIDLIWLQAGIKFNAVTRVKNKIVAISNIHDLHLAIEKKFTDDGISLISCVGKYWCLTNDLTTAVLKRGGVCACNYGWFAKKASGPCLSPGTSCWQRPGFRHNKYHCDPSQTIRLMHRMSRLVYPNGIEELVDLHDIAKDDNLAKLLHHQGKLIYIRQRGVMKKEPMEQYKAITKPVIVTAIESVTLSEIISEDAPTVLSPQVTKKNKNIFSNIWSFIRAFLNSIKK